MKVNGKCVEYTTTELKEILYMMSCHSVLRLVMLKSWLKLDARQPQGYKVEYRQETGYVTTRGIGLTQEIQMNKHRHLHDITNYQYLKEATTHERR